MKKLLLLITLLTVTTSIFASNYPPNYCQQTARFATEGPTVFGSISSGCMSNMHVLGYKNSGIFGNRDFIEAIITIHASTYDGGHSTQTIVVPMTREWNGTGLMSAPIRLPSPSYGSSSIRYIEIAFSSEGKWDSNYGSNYKFSPNSFNRSKRADSQSSSGSNIDLSLWDFIVSLMY